MIGFTVEIDTSWSGAPWYTVKLGPHAVWSGFASSEESALEHVASALNQLCNPPEEDY